MGLPVAHWSFSCTDSICLLETDTLTLLQGKKNRATILLCLVTRKMKKENEMNQNGGFFFSVLKMECLKQKNQMVEKPINAFKNRVASGV